MAAMCWFVIFTYAWHMSFRAIGKIQERIDKKASYFHVIAWSIPLVLTITILAISEVDANSTVGICFVGYVNHPIRGGFVLGPVICSLLIGGYFLIRGIVILINLKISSKQIISTRANQKIRQSIVRMGICSLLMFIFIITTILCHIYEFKNSAKWAMSLRESIICRITTMYSEEDASSCRMTSRPSISLLQLHLMSLFLSGMVMASFVFTPSSLDIWSRYFRRKISGKVDEPLKLQKHKVIAQAFAKRKVFQNQGRLSISFHNSHTDPCNLKFDMSDMNSAVGSHDFSSTWANNLPRFVNRRYALTGCPSSSRSSHGHRRNSIDSEISFSVRHVSVESRRNSNDSQVSVKIAEMKTKVASRSRGSKSKSRSSRHQRRDFTSKRYSRKESSTSMESQILQIAQRQGAHHSAIEPNNEMALVPMSHHRRRSGLIADLSPEQINELIAKNRFLLPYLTTSEDEKSSVGSFNIQDSKLDAILKQIGLSEHKIIENKLNSDHHEGDSGEIKIRKSINDYSDLSSKENIATLGSRAIKSSNRSINSKKGLKMPNRARKGRKSSRTITRNANPLISGSGKMKLDKKEMRKSKDKENLRKSQEESFNSLGIELTSMNLHGSYSGRSDIGIQTELAHESSTEFIDNFTTREMDDHDDEDEITEDYKLLNKRTSISHSKRRGTNEISLTESEKLKLLLLPSK
jgi:smoothened protein